MNAPGYTHVQTPLAGLVELALTDPGLRDITQRATEGVGEAALVGSVSMTAQWWLNTREPKKEVVAAHLVNLMWNGLTHLESDPVLHQG